MEMHVQGCIQKFQTESIMKYMFTFVVCFCPLQRLWKGPQFLELHIRQSVIIPVFQRHSGSSALVAVISFLETRRNL